LQAHAKSGAAAKAPAPKQKKPKPKKSEPTGRLCIYPAVGKDRLVQPLGTNVSFDAWAGACASNGGYPVERESSRIFLEPHSGLFYITVSRTADGWLVKPHQI